MSKQSFSELSLRETLEQRVYKSKFVRKKKLRDESLSEIADEISLGIYKSHPLSSFGVKGHIVYSTKTLQDEAIYAKLNENIKRAYKVKQSDRQNTIKQIISLLSEECPKYIYKLDIKEFYESIDVDSCINKIENDQLLAADSEIVLKDLKRQLNENNIAGLPRGLSISSTLSELTMRPFDKKIMSNTKVYYYARFVDDMIIFSLEKLDIKKEIYKHLPTTLFFNWKKTKILRVINCNCDTGCSCAPKKCKCWEKCTCKLKESRDLSFNYLGYSFKFKELAKPKSSKDLEIDISKQKYDKIRKRISKSFYNYHKKGNFKLLESRIKFLTGNYFLPSQQHHTRRIKSGVFYNYQHINKTKKYHELDKELIKQINTKRSRKIKLSRDHIKKLAKYSFRSGFKNKVTHNFDGHQINKIKGCWING